jgi:hypothetical protein
MAAMIVDLGPGGVINEKVTREAKASHPRELINAHPRLLDLAKLTRPRPLDFIACIVLIPHDFKALICPEARFS